MIEYIEQNLDRDLRLAEPATLVYMSPYHFARLFEGSTGMPPVTGVTPRGYRTDYGRDNGPGGAGG